MMAIPTPANHFTSVDSTLAISACVAKVGEIASKRASREVRRVSILEF